MLKLFTIPEVISCHRCCLFTGTCLARFESLFTVVMSTAWFPTQVSNYRIQAIEFICAMCSDFVICRYKDVVGSP